MKLSKKIEPDFIDLPNKRTVVYYGIMTVLTVLLMQPGIELPMILRLVYMALIFAPLFSAKKYTPFVVTAFYTVSYCSFVGLLPFSIGYPFVCLLVLWYTSRQRGKIPPIIIITSIYCFIISFFFWDFEQTGVLWFGVLMAFMISAYIKTKQDLTILAYAFVTIAFVLSVVFLINRDVFMYTYTHSAEAMDRSGWMNPNDLGGTIGCGTVVAMGMLLNGKKKRFFFLAYLIVTIGLSFMVLALNASRGALLAVMVGSALFIIINNRISLFYKILVVFLAALFLFFLYNNSYFDLLEVRLLEEADEQSGGSRFGIWTQKLDAFKRYDTMSHLFGIGQLDCKELGTRHIRTHNDFLTAFVAYGYIGLFVFVMTVLYPLYHKMSKNKLLATLPYMSFLLIECFVLEPLMRGYFVFIVFYLFVSKTSSLYVNEANSEQ